ncbi:hypothetical protein TRVL_05053 [Trypanosoma vivax]|uniref:Divalent cation transporter n=1 Tax=Trypanosoma vivax (strain Y486) TaxID=1055687 RepID=G0U245_TRYVY|nr:hypothetical protein TRVL_05053 [Trypanosoma vivax]CCC50348.1 conserved hypothetical protein [Trypanosoma vivax Y486]
MCENEHCPPSGRGRLLIRRNGLSEIVQIDNVCTLESAMGGLESFPAVPKSHTTLYVPSVAELYNGDETSVSSSKKACTSPVDFAWLEVESECDMFIDKVLSFFPIHPSTREDITDRENATEFVKIFSSCGYVWVNVAVKGATLALTESGQVNPVMVSMVAFERFLLTVIRRPHSCSEDGKAHMELILRTPTSHDSPVSTAVCSLIGTYVKEYQKELLSLLVDIDSVNELVLEIQPCRGDQVDLLRRIDDLRHTLSCLQASFSAKERVVKQLLLPVMRHMFVTSDPGVVSRYQRLLTVLLFSIERLRKGRDVLNMSSMTLVSGVSMRLLQRCYRLDYLNNILTRMTLVTMPMCIIPGIFTMNVRVPFERSEGYGAFLSVLIVTVLFFLLGMIHIAHVYFTFKSPGALIPPSFS